MNDYQNFFVFLHHLLFLLFNHEENHYPYADGCCSSSSISTDKESVHLGRLVFNFQGRRSISLRSVLSKRQKRCRRGGADMVESLHQG